MSQSCWQRGKMAAPSQPAHASHVGAVQPIVGTLPASPPAGCRADMGGVATRHISGGAGWWKSPCPDLVRASGEQSPGATRPPKGMVRKNRLVTIEQSLHLLVSAHHTVKAFAVVVDKAVIYPDDPVEYAFEEICNRFNLFLARIYRRDGEPQRGLVVMDKSHYEETLQVLARRFREKGARWAQFLNLAEVPLFVDSAASRLIQLADLLAWAVWRRYEHADARYFDPMIRRFDSEGGVIYGLVHRHSERECFCPACMSRSLRGPRRN